MLRFCIWNSWGALQDVVSTLLPSSGLSVSSFDEQVEQLHDLLLEHVFQCQAEAFMNRANK